MHAGGDEIAKTCGCGSSYTIAEYRELGVPSGGLMLELDDGLEPSRIEHRQCRCGNTMGLGYRRDGSIMRDDEI